MYTKAFAILLFSGRIEVNALTAFLEKRKLFSLLPGIQKELALLEERKKKSGMVTIESPFTPDENAKAHIHKLIGVEAGAEDILVENKALLSGFRALYKGKSYDASGERIIRELISK